MYLLCCCIAGTALRCCTVMYLLCCCSAGTAPRCCITTSRRWCTSRVTSTAASSRILTSVTSASVNTATNSLTLRLKCRLMWKRYVPGCKWYMLSIPYIVYWVILSLVSRCWIKDRNWLKIHTAKQYCKTHYLLDLIFVRSSPCRYSRGFIFAIDRYLFGKTMSCTKFIYKSWVTTRIRNKLSAIIISNFHD